MLSVSEYKSMEMGPLKPTSVTIQVADRNILHPEGVIEDVLVKVNGFIYPVDFYVVDLKPDLPSCQTDVLLGRPFLRTAKAKIDCSEWSISLDFFGNTAKFNMSEKEGILRGQYSFNFLDVVKPIVDKVNQLKSKNPYEIVLCRRSTALTSIAGASQGLTTLLKPLPIKSSDVKLTTWKEEDGEVTDKTKGIWSNDEAKKDRCKEKLIVHSIVWETAARVDSLKFYQSSGARGNRVKTLQNNDFHHRHHYLHIHYPLSVISSKKLPILSISSPPNSPVTMTVDSSHNASSDDLDPFTAFHNMPPSLTPRALQVIPPTIIDLTDEQAPTKMPRRPF